METVEGGNSEFDSETLYNPWIGMSSYFDDASLVPFVSLAQNVVTRASLMPSQDHSNSFLNNGTLENQEGCQILDGESLNPLNKEKKRKKMSNEDGDTEDKNGAYAVEQNEKLKEEYAHVRAKRGRSTNSHSLAERLRRERIGERMKFLQDIVPGCNKITGKAVMLDEIINYVLSMQRQVELLSMKLASVNPEMNLDIERRFH
ncbi:hypothetical protein LguiB_019336 [Lonicera macranthoides]